MACLGKAFSKFALLLAALLLVSGCERSLSTATVAETDEAAFRRAKDLLARNLNNEALSNFQKLIIQRGGSAPESHLEAGLIHLNHIKDPVSAIYHFNRYKSLLASEGPTPSAAESIRRVDELIKTASKDFLKSYSLASQAYQEPLERLKLLDTIEQLRRENSELNARLTAANDRLRVAGQVKVESASAAISGRANAPSAPAPAQPQTPDTRQTYTVQAGDTLSKISRKFYGDSNRWQEIADANKATLPNSANLSVGTVLVIP